MGLLRIEFQIICCVANNCVHITVYPDTSVGLDRTVEEEIFSVAIF